MRTFADALRLLMSLYPKFDLSTEQAQAWGAALADVDADALCAAALQLSRESAYLPSIAEWHARALTLSGRGDAHRMSAADAWDEMRRHRTKRAQARYNVSPYIPNWSSDAVRRAAEAVSWDDPDWQTEQMPTIRAQFERYYNAIDDKTKRIESSEAARELLPGAMRRVEGFGPRRIMEGGA